MKDNWYGSYSDDRLEWPHNLLIHYRTLHPLIGGWWSNLRYVATVAAEYCEGRIRSTLTDSGELRSGMWLYGPACRDLLPKLRRGWGSAPCIAMLRQVQDR